LSKLIQFYLDESGNTLSDFFVVGGFYIVSDDINNIRGIESKIKANILHIEKAIKEFRKNNEESLEQYIPLDNSKNHREVK
jgi:wobble nucleotide-excising tRNase